MGLKILMTAGGSGGHLFPAQALASKLKKKEAQVFFAGGDLSKNVFFDASNFEAKDIDCATLSLKKGFKNFRAIWLLLKGFCQSIKLIKSFKPDIVIGFGSYHTIPVLLASIFCHKKIYLHEQNVVMGKANILFARLASRLFVTFPATINPSLLEKSQCVKMPLKADSKRFITDKYRKKLAINSNALTILVCGGSQGAIAINNAFLDALKIFHKSPINVLHLIGKNSDQAHIKHQYQKLNIKAYVKEFDANIEELMLLCDFVIARAGASTVCELIEFNVPAILIPYPFAGQHQYKNAEFFVQTVQGGVMLLQKDLNAKSLSHTMSEFFQKEKLWGYREKIKDYKLKHPQPSFEDALLKDFCIGN